MATTMIIIGIILLIICAIAFYCDRYVAATLFAFAGGYVLSVPMWEYGKPNNPTAMDVYQGKTTLEITYRDGVAVDSIVVFKNKEK